VPMKTRFESEGSLIEARAASAPWLSRTQGCRRGAPRRLERLSRTRLPNDDTAVSAIRAAWRQPAPRGARRANVLKDAVADRMRPRAPHGARTHVGHIEDSSGCFAQGCSMTTRQFCDSGRAAAASSTWGTSRVVENVLTDAVADRVRPRAPPVASTHVGHLEGSSGCFAQGCPMTTRQFLRFGLRGGSQLVV
jgi:hypothetical protein